jgi:preprotein translocase SecE subunit
MSDSGPAKYLSIGGTLVIAVGGFFIAYYFVYCKRSTADFLVKTDTEMSKVSWPAVSPWFKPEAKVWGATYVVLIFTGILALYVFGVDSLLNLISQWSFYPSNS